jgi:hypothetical protein
VAIAARLSVFDALQRLTQTQKAGACSWRCGPYKNVSRETFLSGGGPKPYEAEDTARLPLVRSIDFPVQLQGGVRRRLNGPAHYRKPSPL